MDKMNEKEVLKMREVMGTLPDSQPKRSDKILVGLDGIRVELIDSPTNPYYSIFELVTSTWAGQDKWLKRWENAALDGRIAVVKAALEGKTLPHCLEAPKFTFRIFGPSRSAFDQLARNRFSAFGSVGFRDNRWSDASLRVPSDLKNMSKEIKIWWKYTKSLYEKILNKGQSSWQSARAILPMGTCWRWTWAVDYMTFKNVCAQRMSFCEQGDTCFTVWAMWAELRKKFPLLAAYCRPRCDFIKKCYYSDVYSLSIMFGSLFAPCGRWAVKDYVATFPNLSAADPKEVDSELKLQYGFGVPKVDEWNKIVEEAVKIDSKYFMEK